VLASFCEKVISPEMDYYYLRMRAGIANYELGKYRAAAKHFEKAKLFNNSDAITNSYLQYAYLYCNRAEEAKQVDQFNKNAVFKNKYNAITIESGFKITSRPNINVASLNGISFTHGLGKKATLIHCLNSYLQNEERYNVQQLQYYLRYTVALKGNFKLQIGGHYVFSNVMPKNYLVYEPPGFTHKPPPLTQTILNIPANAISYTTIILPTQKNHEYIVSANLIKQCEKIDLNFGTTLTKLDTTNLQMLNAGFVFYPFSNNDFQIGFQTYAYTFTQTSNWHFAFAPSITVKLFDKCYFQANFFKNQNVNIVEQCGMLFNNSIDYTNQRISISPSYMLSKKLSFYGTYFIEQKRHLNDGTNYTYHLFLLGTKYYF
ncbi:MAG: hypothetical protein WCR21_08830, partial [Bacteroidota bacterium]